MHNAVTLVWGSLRLAPIKFKVHCTSYLVTFVNLTSMVVLLKHHLYWFSYRETILTSSSFRSQNKFNVNGTCSTSNAPTSSIPFLYRTSIQFMDTAFLLIESISVHTDCSEKPYEVVSLLRLVKAIPKCIICDTKVCEGIAICSSQRLNGCHMHTS